MGSTVTGFAGTRAGNLDLSCRVRSEFAQGPGSTHATASMPEGPGTGRVHYRVKMGAGDSRRIQAKHCSLEECFHRVGTIDLGQRVVPLCRIFPRGLLPEPTVTLTSSNGRSRLPMASACRPLDLGAGPYRVAVVEVSVARYVKTRNNDVRQPNLGR